MTKKHISSKYLLRAQREAASHEVNIICPTCYEEDSHTLFNADFGEGLDCKYCKEALIEPNERGVDLNFKCTGCKEERAFLMLVESAPSRVECDLCSQPVIDRLDIAYESEPVSDEEFNR
jgi:ribosomal protein S27E